MLIEELHAIKVNLKIFSGCILPRRQPWEQELLHHGVGQAVGELQGGPVGKILLHSGKSSVTQVLGKLQGGPVENVFNRFLKRYTINPSFPKNEAHLNY